MKTKYPPSCPLFQFDDESGGMSDPWGGRIVEGVSILGAGFVPRIECRWPEYDGNYPHRYFDATSPGSSMGDKE